jgi:hypothetical protein
LIGRDYLSDSAENLVEKTIQIEIIGRFLLIGHFSLADFQLDGLPVGYNSETQPVYHQGD